MKSQKHSNAGTNWIEIWFNVAKDERGYPKSIDWEGLWAEPIGGGNFIIQSIPFYVKNVSKGDVVSAHTTENATHEFKTILQRGAHSTYRILLSDKYERNLDSVIEELSRMGAASEVEIGCLVAIDAPPDSKQEILAFIKKGFKKGYWDEDDGFIVPD